jgi:hypothetical protein
MLDLIWTLWGNLLYPCCRDGFINLKPGLEVLCLKNTRQARKWAKSPGRDAQPLDSCAGGAGAGVRRRLQAASWGKDGPLRFRPVVSGAK